MVDTFAEIVHSCDSMFYVLEAQNKALIEELKNLKELYANAW